MKNDSSNFVGKAMTSVAAAIVSLSPLCVYLLRNDGGMSGFFHRYLPPLCGVAVPLWGLQSVTLLFLGFVLLNVWMDG